MLVSIAVMLLLIIVVFAFVLEPVLRARQDRSEYDEKEVIVIPDFRMYLEYSEGAPLEEGETEESESDPAEVSTVPEARRIESQS